MAIPAIPPYPMPVAEELPTNTARWTVDPRRAALLIHDMQEYFLRPFPAGGSPLRELVGNAVALRGLCRERGMPILYTAQPGGMTDRQRGLLKDFWGAGMSADPEQRRIVEPLRPAADDVVLTKWRASAYIRTGLRELLAERGRDQLVVCGVYAHVGILMTANDGLAHDVQTFVVGDAVADFTAEQHRHTLRYVATRCAMAVSTAQVARMLGGAPVSIAASAGSAGS